MASLFHPSIIESFTFLDPLTSTNQRNSQKTWQVHQLSPNQHVSKSILVLHPPANLTQFWSSSPLLSFEQKQPTSLFTLLFSSSPLSKRLTFLVLLMPSIRSNVNTLLFLSVFPFSPQLLFLFPLSQLFITIVIQLSSKKFVQHIPIPHPLLSLSTSSSSLVV